MIRSAFSKLLWMARATSTIVGLAIMVALVLGVATAGLGATGGNFILGNPNSAGAVSKLTANIAGPALQLVNQSTASGASALGLTVASGKPPLKVNSAAGKATNLNADRVDGLDSTSLTQARGDINGNSANFSGILEHSEGSSFLNTGFHTVVAHAPEGPPVDVLLSCPSQTGSGTLRIVNNTADFGDSQRVWVDDGSANPSFNTLGQNQSVEKTVSPNGDHFTIKVASVFNANRMSTIELFTEQFGPSVCVAKAHVIYTFAS
jgi:FlaG/FlaF family flagellin (archaellin)